MYSRFLQGYRKFEIIFTKQKIKISAELATEVDYK